MDGKNNIKYKISKEYLPKSKIKKVWFSRLFLEKKLKEFGELKCYYCINRNLKIQWNSNFFIPPNKLATIDHVIPLSQGAIFDDESNLVVSCMYCNSRKQSFTQEEFINQL